MSATCEKLHPFVDGELTDEEAKAFRLHLGQCSTCAGDLEAAVMCDALAEEVLLSGRRRPATLEIPAVEDTSPQASTTERVAPPDPTDELAARRRRRNGFFAAGGGLAVAAAAAILIVRAQLPATPLTALLDEPYRSIEGRLAYPGLDSYRPLGRVRGGAVEASHPERTQLLANLEEKNDRHGLGVALLLDGQLEQAARQLATAPASAAVLSDSAALAIQRGAAREALTFADRALALEPRHPQATWNRAVALEVLGWGRQAAEAFEAAATLGDAGWSDEARRRAAELRAQEK